MSRRLTRLVVVAALPALAIAACNGDPAPEDGATGGKASGGKASGGQGSGGKGSGGASSGGRATGGDGGSDDSEPVTIEFRAKLGDDAFSCGKKYKKQGSSEVEVTPQDLRLYVSELRLLTPSGDEVPVKFDERSPWQAPTVALLDFEDASGGCKNGNKSMNTSITGRVPAGSYTGVIFSTSVPKALNHADPATLPDPLQAGGMSWGWLFGYKFIRAELIATKAPAEDEKPGRGVFHLGSTGCDNRPMGEGGAGGESSPQHGAPPAVDCSYQNRNEIRLDSFDPDNDAIVLDVSALMSDVDMSVDAQCHSMQMQMPCETLFPKIGVDSMTGAPKESQTTFRVEAQ
jgi:uncharacterized repeat protein (TIGR04052 family)